MKFKASSLGFFLLVFLCTFCGKNDKKNIPETLSFYLAENIPVPQPSGLDLSTDEKGFWTASDQNSTVYLIDSWGKVKKKIKVNGEDIEGITVVDQITLAVVLERSREVVLIDTSGLELKRMRLELDGNLNEGLEGIAYDSKGKRFYVLNEKNPRLLITLDVNLNELSKDTLNFSNDVSGIHYDVTDNTLWIVSDENRMIFNTDLSGNPIEEFKIKIAGAEGISFNKTRTKLYIVSDQTENLYVFNFNKGRNNHNK